MVKGVYKKARIFFLHRKNIYLIRENPNPLLNFGNNQNGPQQYPNNLPISILLKLFFSCSVRPNNREDRYYYNILPLGSLVTTFMCNPD